MIFLEKSDNYNSNKLQKKVKENISIHYIFTVVSCFTQYLKKEKKDVSLEITIWTFVFSAVHTCRARCFITISMSNKSKYLRFSFYPASVDKIREQ